MFDARTAATFGKARQDLVESVSGHSGITNPALAARMEQVALQELADRESAEVAHGWVYVQQALTPIGGTVEKINGYIE